MSAYSIYIFFLINLFRKKKNWQQTFMDKLKDNYYFLKLLVNNFQKISHVTDKLLKEKRDQIDRNHIEHSICHD